MKRSLKLFLFVAAAVIFFFLQSGCKKDPYPGYDVEIDATELWTEEGTFSGGSIFDMTSCNGKLWFGGNFTTAPSGYNAKGIANYDGTNFNTVNDVSFYSNPAFYKFLVSGDTLYAAGVNISSSKGNFLYWNSTSSSWQTKNLSTNYTYAVAKYNNKFFTSYYYSSYYYVGFWDGITWDGKYFDNLANEFEVYNNELYAIGSFDYIDGNYRYYIARFNDLTWNSVGANSSANQGGEDLVVYNNELYVCGNFSSMGLTSQTSGIAKWNGTSWSTVGGGLTNGGSISKMCACNGNLYVCGNFNEMGGVVANGVAKWNGSSWSAVGKKFTGYYPSCLAEYNGSLYVADNNGVIHKYTFH